MAVAIRGLQQQASIGNESGLAFVVKVFQQWKIFVNAERFARLIISWNFKQTVPGHSDTFFVGSLPANNSIVVIHVDWGAGQGRQEIEAIGSALKRKVSITSMKFAFHLKRTFKSRTMIAL